MQSVRLIVRRVGVPTPELDVISVDDLQEYLEYQLTSQGYKLMGTPDKLDDVKNSSGGTVGWTFALWFVKNDEESSESGGEAHQTAETAEDKPKRGRKARK